MHGGCAERVQDGFGYCYYYGILNLYLRSGGRDDGRGEYQMGNPGSEHCYCVGGRNGRNWPRSRARFDSTNYSLYYQLPAPTLTAEEHEVDEKGCEGLVTSSPAERFIHVDVKGLSKTYDGTKKVLEDISFQVSKGEIFVIIGPSGVGKTTLLRLIDQLDIPSAGSLKINSIETTRLTEKERLQVRRKQGMVFQSTLLFDDSVYNNVAYGLKIREESKANIKPRTRLSKRVEVKIKTKDIIREKVTKALKVVGLEDLIGRHAKTLSGGEIQRIAIARVLAYEPELLLLDELTANLDPSNTAKIEMVVKDVREVYGTTTIVSTHNMFQAKRMADHVAVLFNGRFIEVGDPQTVFEHPKNPMTKAFINGELIY